MASAEAAHLTITLTRIAGMLFVLLCCDIDVRDIFRRGPAPLGLIRLGLASLLIAASGCDSRPSSLAPRGELDAKATDVTTPRPDYFAAAARAVQSRDWATAEASLRQHLLAHPADARAMELSGDVAAARQDLEAAETMYRAAQDTLSTPSRTMLAKRYNNLIRAGKPFDAIDVCRRIIDAFPDDMQARFDLAGISAAVGVPGVALPSLRWLVQRGQSEPETLLMLADAERVEPDDETCEQFLSLAHGDLRPGYGLAKLDAIQENWDSAAVRLRRILAEHPDFVPAHVLMGRAMLKLGLTDQLEEWQTDAPESAQASADYWVVLGQLAQQQSRHDQAAFAFYQSLRLDESSRPEVLAALVVSLHQLDRSEDAAKLTSLGEKLSTLRDTLKIHLERGSQSQAACMRVAETMLDLGRVWEAEAWARLAVSLPKDKVNDLRQRYMAIREPLTTSTPWQLASGKWDAVVDLSDLEQHTTPTVTSIDKRSEFEASGDIRFEDQALLRGWNHISIPAPRSGGHWIHHSVGGGVAVIDFDCDGWPDLAAATLDGQALQNDSSVNRLSRNVNGKLVDASAAARYDDRGFGQGITVGDYNDDGFPDLLDACVGRNRLYRNNGDGTFTDVSDSVGLSGSRWTTSLVMVDLDGDNILDLYEANYCAGEAPYTHECRNRYGLGTCTPLTFDAEPDCVWQGRGDGTFVEVTQAWMKQSSPGRGLGLVAGMIDEQPGLDVLVANDMTVNHLWSRRQQSPSMQLIDLGVVRGLGTSGNSRSQASMGIAAGDADGDGDLDFVMTHFADDHNTFYEQIAPGFWDDRSYQIGLAEPSMKLLGFGTQWADFDNRGNLELIVANGHVDRIDRDDVSYRMPPQLFSRSASGRYDERDRASLGEYFTSDHLGRSLVVLDIDRDGRCDVAITHLDDPAALLVNRTPDAGKSIGLELRATNSPRDAIGTSITATVGSRTFSAQLTAGDGYMASNERRMMIGCGTQAEVGDVTITWPSGHVEYFGTLPASQDYLLVEGSALAHLTWNHR